MKLISICVFFLFIIVGCYNKHPQSNDNKTVRSKEDVQIMKGISSDNKPKNVGEKPTPVEIYSKIESRRDYCLHLLSDTATLTKNYSEKIGKKEKKLFFIINRRESLQLFTGSSTKEARKLLLKHLILMKIIIIVIYFRFMKIER